MSVPNDRDLEMAGVIAETDWLLFRASPIHGTGAFAKRHIPAKTKVIEYVGEKIGKSESVQQCQSNNEYIFSLNEEQDINGNVPWNPARLINHSCAPNCEALLEHDHIWIVASRNIAAGEEVTFNYGYDLQDYLGYPCKCGMPSCVGFIVAEEFFERVRKKDGQSNTR